MDEQNKKFVEAVKILKSDAEMVWNDTISSEEDFNKIQWVVGVENDISVLSDTCPHSEITWTKVKEEMDKL